MPILNVSDFSCLHEATFELAPVTIIIGPQGSGKSVTTKLTYFFADILSNFLQSAERGDSLDDYKRWLSRQFSLWFPPSAWGMRRFNINYSAGNFTIRILRRKSRDRLLDDVAVTFSEWFGDTYRQASDLFRRSRAGGDVEVEASTQVSDALDELWRVREVVHNRMSRDLGESYIAQQTFIPAGRAFFTSIGRLVAGFEQAGSLDPVTVKFARLFASLRDRLARGFPARLERLGPEFVERRSEFMNQLFGGEIRVDDEAEFVETDDGRRIPFSSLSSGQQEILPMWVLMDYFNQLDARRLPLRNNRKSKELVYIEEPEAHLFPSAQSLLMEFLIRSIASDRSQRSLIITTHSPYIMGKLNVFLKAGQLARRRKRNQEINEVVSRDCWLMDHQLQAYALEGGRLRTLIDEDGMIDGRYLDQISEDLSRQFSQLLRIESEM